VQIFRIVGRPARALNAAIMNEIAALRSLSLLTSLALIALALGLSEIF
jgi:hypothetical protein